MIGAVFGQQGGLFGGAHHAKPLSLSLASSPAKTRYPLIPNPHKNGTLPSPLQTAFDNVLREITVTRKSEHDIVMWLKDVLSQYYHHPPPPSPSDCVRRRFTARDRGHAKVRTGPPPTCTIYNCPPSHLPDRL